MSWVNDFKPNREYCDKIYHKYVGCKNGEYASKLRRSDWKMKEDKSK